MEDRPIVFTISKTGGSNAGFIFYQVTTKDPRGEAESIVDVYDVELFRIMVNISEVLNNKGYAVLFEVD